MLTPTGLTTRPSRRAAALPPEQRRQAIIEAVIPLLVERGAELTTREIAAAAGVAEGTLFRVFEDKAALLHAAVHSLLDPARTRAALAEVDPLLDLEDMVLAVAEQLLRSTSRVMAVLMALRRSSVHPPEALRSGPPAALRESHEALVEGLTGLFERYRDQLRVEPARAALLLRALVFGSRQPWSDGAEPMTAREIALLLTRGITTRTPTEGGRCSSGC